MTSNRVEIFSNQELLKFENYEDYLDSFITSRDLYHLRSKSLVRQIIEFGNHAKEALDRETFYDRVKAAKRHLYLAQNPYALCSESVDCQDILLQELALRENANRTGELYTIIFMRHFGQTQSQISGYIDYNSRLKSEDWLTYFEGSRKIAPKKSDLSYYNWKSGTSILNESTNFKPIFYGKLGLVFQSFYNSELIIVDPALTLATNPARVTIYSEMYGHIVLYDHNVSQSSYYG